MNALQAQIVDYHDRLARVLGDRAYLCDSFSVADIAHFLTAFFAAGFDVRIDRRHQNLHAWLGRVGARPSVAREVAAMSKALAA